MDDHADMRELVHTAGNLFEQRGIVPGDLVYVVTFYGGDLRIVGGMEVGQRLPMARAKRALGADKVWPARDHLIAAPGKASRVRVDCVVPPAEVGKIRFMTRNGNMPVAYEQSGIPDKQTFRGVREITLATAAMFDQLLAWHP